MGIKMVSPRDYTLRTTAGHTIIFKAGVPTNVPDAVIGHAMAVNILPVAGGYAPDGTASNTVQHKALTGSLRDAVIFNTIQEFVKENDVANFNAGGQPKLSALNAATGIRISGAELSKYWERYTELVGSNSPLPTHPRLENVMELQRLSTRKQLVEYAEDIGIDKSMVNNKSIKEAKELLMAATVSYSGEAPPHVGPLVED